MDFTRSCQIKCTTRINIGTTSIYNGLLWILVWTNTLSLTKKWVGTFSDRDRFICWLWHMFFFHMSLPCTVCHLMLSCIAFGDAVITHRNFFALLLALSLWYLVCSYITNIIDHLISLPKWSRCLLTYDLTIMVKLNE